MQAVIAHEQARGWQVVSVEKENRGFDLISHKPHLEDPQTAIEVRFIEVKGRRPDAHTVCVSKNEWLTSLNKRSDFYLAIVVVDSDEPQEPLMIPDPVKGDPQFGVTSVNLAIKELATQAVAV